MPNNFQVGDRVKRIQTNGRDDRIFLGSIWTILRVDGRSLILENNPYGEDFTCEPSWFELVEPEPVVQVIRDGYYRWRNDHNEVKVYRNEVGDIFVDHLNNNGERVVERYNTIGYYMEGGEGPQYYTFLRPLEQPDEDPVPAATQGEYYSAAVRSNMTHKIYVISHTEEHIFQDLTRNAERMGHKVLSRKRIKFTL